ncbi:uncharacterized protein LOC112463921 [Temnothorax curvispinosus]|uniref:Uncharacterized protein LOC112463921 n=1 Tax=Temnothorax curvispinosus TaxID=300111 RepID=A0A6J1QVI9_9HYME|nr:uncharacterized protein LOC112463921 [Temnothorax curvispinosus]
MIYTTCTAVIVRHNHQSSSLHPSSHASRRRHKDANVAAMRDILQKISSGDSNTEDDSKLVEIIKEAVVRTAEEIKTPTGSIEAAAKKAQILVSELTSAYTNAIYNAKSPEDGRENFVRFQTTVQAIVEFIKNGQFLA